VDLNEAALRAGAIIIPRARIAACCGARS